MISKRALDAEQHLQTHICKYWQVMFAFALRAGHLSSYAALPMPLKCVGVVSQSKDRSQILCHAPLLAWASNVRSVILLVLPPRLVQYLLRLTSPIVGGSHAQFPLQYLGFRAGTVSNFLVPAPDGSRRRNNTSPCVR